MKRPPGPRGREVFGFFANSRGAGPVLFLERCARRYGPLSSFRVLNQRVYMVDDADLVQEVLVTRQHSFVRDTGATLLRELVGDGVLTRDEPAHKQRRRILQPVFHRDVIAEYTGGMVREAERFRGSLRPGQTLDINRAMKELTLAIVGVSLFGTDFRDSAARVADVLGRVIRRAAWLAPVSALSEPLIAAYRRRFPQAPSLFFRSERRDLETIVNPIVETRRVHARRDMLSILLSARDEDGSALTDNEVRNELITFVLAGHETTATTLTWTWYLLARHPEAEQRMHAELDSVADAAPLSAEIASRLPYTANVLKEAMRLYPAALAFGRRPAETLTLGGYTIPKGSTVMLSPYVTQRNPRYFERPNDFNPDRWQDFAGPKLAYFPFGGGAKMCIGEGFARLEALLILATVARQWRFTLEPGALPYEGIVVRPGCPLRLVPVARAAAPLAAALSSRTERQ